MEFTLTKAEAFQRAEPYDEVPVEIGTYGLHHEPEHDHKRGEWIRDGVAPTLANLQTPAPIIYSNLRCVATRLSRRSDKIPLRIPV